MDDAVNLLDGLDIDLPDPGQGGPAGQAASAAEHANFFGPYQLIQQVGQGGVAKVMRARHIHPGYADTTFAIKILHEELSRDPRVVSLFRHEAYVLSLLKHPNVVQTFEAGMQDNKMFIAMEYIDGRDLDNMVLRCQRTKTPLPIPIAMHIVGEVLKSLAYAHELSDSDGNRLNLVHRDINPANVFLSYDGRVKLGDFGVASIAAGMVEKSRELAGKVGYFAPEQLAGDPVDHRADLFAMGVMIFEMLTGARLFEADNADKIMQLNKRAKIPKPSGFNPQITSELEAALLTALERKPKDRYASARAMLQAFLPFIPSSVGMSLAVAALMRKVFLNEHMQELQLREGLAGAGISRGSGQSVAVCTADERARAAFNELLLSRGYRPMLCATPAELGASFASVTPPVTALIDVCQKGFSPAQYILAMRKAPRAIPVVAVSEQLDLHWVHLADALGAVDLLFKPFNIERVLTAVRAAITGAVSVAQVDAPGVVSHLGVRPRLLLLTQDPKLVGTLGSALAERGYDVEMSPTVAEAIERTDHASYHAVIYDAHPAQPPDLVFPGLLRGRPAMGLVPIIFLASPEIAPAFAGIDRSEVRGRSDNFAGLGDSLNRLWADNRLGRIFIRYLMSFPVELRYGGRVFNGQATDISRGGTMLFCDQMPPVGTDVGVSLRLPGSASAIQVTGRVMRVDLPKAGTGEARAGIGVEFERFHARGEGQLIAFLATLDPGSERRRTVILNSR